MADDGGAGMDDGGDLGALAARVADLLVEMVCERVPERDVARSEELRRDLVELLPSDMPGWNAGRATVADAVASRFRERSEDWLAVAKLLGTYFQFVYSPDLDHPRGAGTRVQKRGEPPRVSIHLDLAPLVLGDLLHRASSAERIAWLSRVDDWDSMRALAAVLPSLAMTAEEAIAAVEHLDARTGTDLGRGGVLNGVVEWARAHPDAARDAVERWRRGVARLGEVGLRIFVEGSLYSRPDLIPWRDEIVAELIARDLRAVALQLETFAWPAGMEPHAAERHARLVERVQRIPTMRRSALTILDREAARHPCDAMRTLRALVGDPSAGLDHQDAAWVARVLRRAFQSLDVSERAVITVELALAEAVPPSLLQDALDDLLGDLFPIAEDAVVAFLRGWLVRHRADLASGGRSLEELFPSFVHALGDRQGWLVARLLTDADETVRAVGGRLLRHDAARIRPDDLADWPAPRIEALACELVAGAASGWVNLLYRLGLAFPELIPAVMSLLTEDAVVEYPGECEDGLSLWADSVDERVLEHHRRVAEALGALDAAVAAKRAVPEMRATVESNAFWIEAATRQLRRLHDEQIASGRFPLLALVPRVPIARGEGTVHAGVDGGKPTRFGHIESGGELPWRSLVDPVSTAVRHVELRERAARLLAGLS